DFFLQHSFSKARDMVNFVLELVDMPTPAARRASTFAPLKPADLPALARLAPEALRTTSPAALEQWYFRNPYFPPEALFAARNRDGGQSAGVESLINNPD